MELSVTAFLSLLACVAIERIVELRISRRHQQELAGRGVRKRRDPHYRWMVLLHGGVLAGAAVEVLALHRLFIPWLAAVAGSLFVLATLLRWWVIRALGVHWNVEVMDSAPLGIVVSGPFRWVRHPNYLGVFIELVALPLIHTAWITALAGGIANVFVLRHRLRVEEPALEAEPGYRAAMSGKPRFLPKLF
jgi:methyltransferase